MKYSPLKCLFLQRHVLLQHKFPFVTYYRCKDCGQRFSTYIHLHKSIYNFGIQLQIWFLYDFRLRVWYRFIGRHTKSCPAHIEHVDEYCTCGFNTKILRSVSEEQNLRMKKYKYYC